MSTYLIRRCALGFVLLAFHGIASAAETTGSAEVRDSARMMAQIEASLDARDLKGYCAATVGRADYTGYVERACQYGVKLKVKTLQDCEPARIAAEVEKDRAQCLAMSAAEFNETISRHFERRAEWIKIVSAKGVDAGKLLDEERAKLK